MSTFPTLKQRVCMALDEDLGEAGDVTTDAIFPEDAQGSAYVIAKEAGVLCGVDVFAMVFEVFTETRRSGDQRAQVVLDKLKKDGVHLAKGDRVMNLRGPIRTLLAGERTALNFIQHLSGIASMTARFVELTGGRVEICDIRKTTPLWRDLEKYAVKCGGGVNHRMGLYDMIMLKDTHADGAGSLAHALELVQPRRKNLRVAAEARNMEEVRAALAAKVDLLMLDNMDRETLREAIALIGNRIPTEITGGITLETAAELSKLGVTRLSIGALTHSVKAMDFSMKLERG